MRYLILLLSLAGVLVSVQALRGHYATETEPCSISERLDCDTVNHSSYSEVFQVPVAAIGIGGYLLLAILALFRRQFMLTVAAVVGLIFSLHMTGIEWDLLNMWCLYCAISQALIALIVLFSAIWLVRWEMEKNSEKSNVRRLTENAMKK